MDWLELLEGRWPYRDSGVRSKRFVNLLLHDRPDALQPLEEDLLNPLTKEVDRVGKLRVWQDG